MKPWKIALKNNCITKSTRKNKKLMIKINNKSIHFGSRDYEHYFDETGIWEEKNHKDIERLKDYIKRHSAIKKKDGTLAINDPESASYWSLYILWNPIHINSEIDKVKNI